MNQFTTRDQGFAVINDALIRTWWIPALRGVIAIAFGVLALMRPDMTLLALMILFAAFALLSGAVSIAGALRHRKADADWWMPLLIGLAMVGAGLIAVLHPGLTALVLVLLIGANALITGVLDIISAIRLRKTLKNEWLLMVSGAAGVIFGIAVFLFPGAGALAMIWLISLYALIIGVLLLMLAFRLRSMVKAGAPERRTRPDRRTTPAHS